jgi:hypothetical protein
VRGVTRDRIASTITSGEATGNGTGTTITRAPIRSATYSSALRQAL